MNQACRGRPKIIPNKNQERPLTDVVLFHHAQGLTDGVRQFAGQLRAAGHQVTVPDLYEGQVFGSIPEGLAYAEQTGFDAILERGRLAAEGLPAGVVYTGFSLGVLPAQMLTQTRPGARGALFFHSCVPVSEFGTWPEGVPVQVHAMEADPFFTDEGDIDAARDLVKTAGDGELFLYPGAGHLFADPSLAAYDPAAAALLTERVLAFLRRADVAAAR
jgi:dienelactone hydrolase